MESRRALSIVAAILAWITALPVALWVLFFGLRRAAGKLSRVADRWATFDCYGTLIDWNGGIRAELARVFGEERADELLERYHELEPQVQGEQPALPYRRVMAEAMRRLGAPPREEDALGESLPRWAPPPEAPGAPADLRPRGWRLAAPSNSHPALLEAPDGRLGTPFHRHTP